LPPLRFPGVERLKTLTLARLRPSLPPFQTSQNLPADPGKPPLRQRPALRLPRLPGGRQLPVLPLPRTLSSVALLVLVPALLLARWSRPRAVGLEQLMASASLLQSFPAAPERPVPALWNQRLGPELAARLWQRQRRVWWQLWANHSEAAPFLVLEAERNAPAGRALPPQALRVGDLLVIAEDPLASRQLAQSLRPLQRRSRSGLPQRCLQRLRAGQAVYWKGAALGAIVGPVAPLLDPFQVGCLSLALERQALRWQGEAGAVDGLGALSPAPAAARPSSTAATTPDLAVQPLPAQLPLPPDLLLELEGGSLEPLLQGLLSRPLFRDPLASRYGLEGPRLALARQAPFRLRLRPQPAGPFQASLELQLVVGAARSTWLEVLNRIRTSLLAQGFLASDGPAATATGAAASVPQLPGPAGTPPPAPSAAPSPAAPSLAPGPLAPGPLAPGLAGSSSAVQGPTFWRRPDGTTVGGWLWLGGPDRQSQLLLFLGPPPLAPLPITPSRAARPGPGSLWLRLRPQGLDGIGYLPEEMPALLRQATQIWLDAEPLPGADPAEPISRLTGRLQVNR